MKDKGKKGSEEFYNIPLLGAVHVQHNGEWHGDYDLGELIRNFRAAADKIITVRAMDDELAGAGILGGDYLTVRIGGDLKSGDLAVVRLGQRMYIRKIFFDKKHIRLETAVNNRAPLIIEPKTPGFEQLGKVVSIIREL